METIVKINGNANSNFNIMKKLLSLVFCGLLLFGCSDKYDDSALRNDLNDLENRVEKLEELCKQMNTNISSLQTIITALQNNDYITSVLRQ